MRSLERDLTDSLSRKKPVTVSKLRLRLMEMCRSRRLSRAHVIANAADVYNTQAKEIGQMRAAAAPKPDAVKPR